MRPLNYILDAAGQPVPCDDGLEWARWFGTHDRQVARDIEHDKTGEVCISTVFLGVDHSFSDTSPPVLWETLVFGGVLDGEGHRYTSRADALNGHQQLCARVRETL